MKTELENAFGEVQASVLEQLDRGILLPDFQQFLKEKHISLGVNLKTKYGPVIILTPDFNVWGTHTTLVPNILPGDSVKRATKKLSAEQTLSFLKENKYRTMLRSFKQRYGTDNCFRFYLKKLKKNI